MHLDRDKRLGCHPPELMLSMVSVLLPGGIQSQTSIVPHIFLEAHASNITPATLWQIRPFAKPKKGILKQYLFLFSLPTQTYANGPILSPNSPEHVAVPIEHVLLHVMGEAST